jgi:hypothetical protein
VILSKYNTCVLHFAGIPFEIVVPLGEAVSALTAARKIGVNSRPGSHHKKFKS